MSEKKAVTKSKPKVPKVKTEVEISPQALIKVAVDQGASMDTIERLLAMRKEIKKEKAEQAFREAMSKFQAECPVIPKKKKVMNKDGKTVRYIYAPMDDIIKTCSPYLGKNELSYDIKTTLEAREDIEGIATVIRVFHVLGHSEESSFWSPIDDNTYMSAQQRYGSTRTFSARYAFCDVFGITTGDEDTDGADDEEKNKIQKEKDEKLDALSDDIKEGFKSLGYGRKAAWALCEQYDWNEKKIKEQINYIADNSNNGKLFNE